MPLNATLKEIWLFPYIYRGAFFSLKSSDLIKPNTFLGQFTANIVKLCVGEDNNYSSVSWNKLK